MIEKYVSAPKTLRRLRAGLSGSHIDDFADALEKQGYAHTSEIRYLRAAAHLCRFVQRKGGSLADANPGMLEAFARGGQTYRTLESQTLMVSQRSVRTKRCDLLRSCTHHKEKLPIRHELYEMA